MSKSKRKRPTPGDSKLPLHDPRWLAVDAAAARYYPHPDLAARDLSEDMRTWLHSMRRPLQPYTWERVDDPVIHKPRMQRVPTPYGERLEFSHWDEWELASRPDGLVAIVRSRGGGGQVVPAPYAYFVSEPDLKKFRGDRATVPSSQETARRPPGPRFLTKHDWHTIDGVIGRLCHDDQERLAVPTNEANLIRAVAQYCADRDLPQPADSEIAIAVQRVCAALRAPRPAIDVFRSIPRRPPSKK